MSSPPSTPAPRSSSPNDDEYNAQKELEVMMKTPTSNGDAVEEHPGDISQTDDELPLTVTSQSTTTWTTSALRVESERARRLAVSRKLTPYQRDRVDEFVKLSPLSRDVSMFIMQCEVLNKLESIITTSRGFAVSEPLMENIKAYVMAVLLSSKLASYRGSAPRDHVMDLVRREGLHLPENYENDTSIVRTIGNAVSEELTQCRARIKKELKASIMNNVTVYDLASSLTHHTRCVVTPALCARLALLRAMFVKDSTPGGFWTSIDNQLQRICTAAGGDAVKITRAFSVYLDKDRTRYGGSAEDAPSLSPLAATWQESVDGIIENN